MIVKVYNKNEPQVDAFDMAIESAKRFVARFPEFSFTKPTVEPIKKEPVKKKDAVVDENADLTKYNPEIATIPEEVENYNPDITAPAQKLIEEHNIDIRVFYPKEKIIKKDIQGHIH